MNKWKVLTRYDEIENPGIYQEKMIILIPDELERELLKKMVTIQRPEAEPCEVPRRILKNHPYAFGYWVNKIEGRCTKTEIKEGNIRMLIR